MPDGLYERDVLLWSERQADLLRRLAAGERVNAEVDWENVIEEVGDVGLSELNACRSLLEQAMLHLLKLHVMPDASSTLHWRAEVWAFLGGVGRRFAPSMKQRIDLDREYRDAVEEVRGLAGDAGVPMPALPATCPWKVEELTGVPKDIDALLGKLNTPT